MSSLAIACCIVLPNAIDANLRGNILLMMNVLILFTAPGITTAFFTQRREAGTRDVI